MRFGQAGYTPSSGIDEFFSDTFYLKEVDSKWRRTYAMKKDLQSQHTLKPSQTSSALTRLEMIHGHLKAKL